MYGPLKVGYGGITPAKDYGGLVALTHTFMMNPRTAGTVVYIAKPGGRIFITDIYLGIAVASDAATSCLLTVGRSVGNADFAAAMSLKTAAGILRPVPTGAMVNEWTAGYTGDVYFTLVTTGAATVGQVRLFFNYLQEE
jgi:hypothetical protein